MVVSVEVGDLVEFVAFLWRLQCSFSFVFLLVVRTLWFAWVFMGEVFLGLWGSFIGGFVE